MDGRLPTIREVALTDEDRLRRTIIERLMCDFSVDLNQIGEAHATTACDFSRELQAIDDLAQEGLVIRDGLSISVPEDSRALVRNVCAVFDQYLNTGAARYSRAV
jgi:oxygen-independent coproporphyrinogen-3 oxidase